MPRPGSTVSSGVVWEGVGANPMSEAYLDIETTGLSRDCHAITVIGIYRVDSGACTLLQLVGDDVTRDNLLEALEGVETIFTYNGRRFDLPFILTYLGVDLAEKCNHHDVMYDCWRNGLYGGLKGVERQLGIARRLQGIDGADAVRLWWRYRNYEDHEALTTLLEYNSEDLVNLRTLRQILACCLP